jgi:hypothetical protein
MYVYIYTCIYTYTHTHTHTYIYIYICIFFCSTIAKRVCVYYAYYSIKEKSLEHCHHLGRQPIRATYPI